MKDGGAIPNAGIGMEGGKKEFVAEIIRLGASFATRIHDTQHHFPPPGPSTHDMLPVYAWEAKDGEKVYPTRATEGLQYSQDHFSLSGSEINV